MGVKNKLLNQKGGDLETNELFSFGNDTSDGSAWAKAKNGDFKISFIPWAPDNEEFTRAKWSFKCYRDNFSPAGYPEQICGKHFFSDLFALAFKKVFFFYFLKQKSQCYAFKNTGLLICFKDSVMRTSDGNISKAALLIWLKFIGGIARTGLSHKAVTL